MPNLCTLYKPLVRSKALRNCTRLAMILLAMAYPMLGSNLLTRVKWCLALSYRLADGKRDRIGSAMVCATTLLDTRLGGGCAFTKIQSGTVWHIGTYRNQFR